MKTYNNLIKMFKLTRDGKLEKYYNNWNGKTGWYEVNYKPNGKKGYCRIGFNGKLLYVHQVVWILFNKKEIEKGMEIDHIDRDKQNNHPLNLRMVSCRKNHCNNRRAMNNGLTGTYLLPNGKWLANIQIKRKTKHLGIYNTEIDAHNAYLKAYNNCEAGGSK